MILLPEIEDKILKRPGAYTGKAKHFVPDLEYDEFWEAVYGTIASSGRLQLPLQGSGEKINPYFGNFGFRWHSINHKPDYFHIGIDISGKAKTALYPVANGVLEYSGYGVVNGNYVFLAHSDIQTEDGYHLCGLYMHLRRISVKFNPYQKMLREMSFHTYPEIPITKDTSIGTIGSTGNAMHAHLHLQLEFRNKKGTIIAVDPARMLGLGFQPKENITALLKTKKDFEALYGKHKKDLHDWRLEKFWTN